MAIVGCSRKVAPKESVIRVNTQQVVTASNGVTKNYVGTIEEEEGVNVTFSVLGTVERVLVDEGQEKVSDGVSVKEN